MRRQENVEEDELEKRETRIWNRGKEDEWYGEMYVHKELGQEE